MKNIIIVEVSLLNVWWENDDVIIQDLSEWWIKQYQADTNQDIEIDKRIQSTTSDQNTLKFQYQNIPFQASNMNKMMNNTIRWRLKYDKASMFKFIQLKKHFES